MAQRRHRSEPNAGAFMGPDVMIPTPMGKLGELPPARELSTGDDMPVPGKTLVERFRERAKRLIGR